MVAKYLKPGEVRFGRVLKLSAICGGEVTPEEFPVLSYLGFADEVGKPPTLGYMYTRKLLVEKAIALHYFCGASIEEALQIATGLRSVSLTNPMVREIFAFANHWYSKYCYADDNLLIAQAATAIVHVNTKELLCYHYWVEPDARHMFISLY